MAQATGVMTAQERRAAALATARAQIEADRERAARAEPTDVIETVLLEPQGPNEDDVIDPSVPEHPESPEPLEDDEDAPDPDETPVSRQALVAQRSGIARVQALLDEALRLGQQYGLVERHADGALVLAGQQRARRESSDCTCPTCKPYAQTHWWCIVCGSGPHDWHLVKPQYERQTLKPGGIEGTRQAACSAQCARDFLASLGRQPSGVPVSQTIDPTLGLP